MNPVSLARAAALAFTVLLSMGAAAFAEDAPSAASKPEQIFAQELLDARQTNVKAQREGRPSVWLAVPMTGNPKRMDSTVKTTSTGHPAMLDRKTMGGIANHD